MIEPAAAAAQVDAAKVQDSPLCGLKCCPARGLQAGESMDCEEKD